MGMRAGERDELVIIQRATSISDAYGEPIQTWAEFVKTWAAILHGRGEERRQAGMEEGVQPATFQMLSTPSTRAITLRDRIIAQGVIWDIRGIVMGGPNRGMVEVVAVTNRDAPLVVDPPAGDVIVDEPEDQEW